MLSEMKREPHAINPELAPLPEAHSTDLGNVNWSMPMGRLADVVASYSLVVHSWQFTAASASIGLSSMPFAAKTLAATALDCFKRPALIEDAENDLRDRADGHTSLTH